MRDYGNLSSAVQVTAVEWMTTRWGIQVRISVNRADGGIADRLPDVGDVPDDIREALQSWLADEL